MQSVEGFSPTRAKRSQPRSSRAVAIFTMAVTLVAGLPVTAGAVEPGWASTFPPSAVERRVGHAGGPVVVVPAGKRSETLSTAADAVAGALERTNAKAVRADVVDGDDDAAIAKTQAAKAGASRVLVVRVFDDGGGREAVVTVYDAQGNVLDAFTGKPGRPIAATSPASAGVGADAAQAAFGATDEAAEDLDEARAAYDRDFVGFEDVYYAHASGSTVVVGKSIAPYRGTYKEPLQGVRFYDHIGRDDLAKKYKRRRATRAGLVGGGAAALVIGVSAGLAIMLRGVRVGDCPSGVDDPVGRDRCEAEQEDTRSQNLRKGGILMGTLGGIGFVAMMAGMMVKPHPINEPEARRLADEYNQGLRDRVGLPKGSAREQAARPSVDVRPTAGRTGAGLVVEGRF
jgi:hypothetical protein